MLRLCPDLGLTALGGPFPWSLVATSYVALGFFRDMGLSSWLLGDRLPFLPLLLTSDAGALLVLAWLGVGGCEGLWAPGASWPSTGPSPRR